ncbi:hypothetical protein MTR67_001710 [Solanum verrucosum]|uniref:Uncharacterized protein n=1 Tax=Solanum verrucosum TaxID=315347 RepID=A0AAF0PSC1_SOLVR|nr:hypothetical protein MTR67_001710 [Solanum verrucosum]
MRGSDLVISKIGLSVCPSLVHPVSVPFWCLHCNLDITRHWQGSYTILSGTSSDLFYVAWVSQLQLYLFPSFCACCCWVFQDQ